MAKTKECAGVPKLGIARHTAPLTDFTVKASRPDGRSRRCKVCQSADRKARRAGGTTAAPKPPSRPMQLVDGTEVQAQELAALEAAVAAAGGSGTDEGQQLLHAAADEAKAARRAADAERKRRQRAAAKAAAGA